MRQPFHVDGLRVQRLERLRALIVRLDRLWQGQATKPLGVAGWRLQQRLLVGDYVLTRDRLDSDRPACELFEHANGGLVLFHRLGRHGTTARTPFLVEGGQYAGQGNAA